jgi:hypothetical protein
MKAGSGLNCGIDRCRINKGDIKLRARLLCLLARVSFDVEISNRSGKPAAVNVRVDLIQAKARVVC